MSAKVKMRCARCGKPFKSAGAKQTLCPACEFKERQARAANKAQGPKPAAATPAAPPAQVKIVGPGAGILVPGMTPPPAAAPETSHAQQGMPAHPDRHGPTHPRPHSGQAAQPAASQHPAHDKTDRHAKVDKAERQPGSHTHPPKTKAAAQTKERKPATPPFVLTDDLRAAIERRYLELAQPVEFDGIRTRISDELRVPKAAVRRVVQEVRASKQLPSWWELQAFTGTDEDLARIKAAYEPLLPIPPVGVHKELAASLGLEPIMVYRGIRRVRAELRLPQYNPPELHESQTASGTSEMPTAHTTESDAPPDASTPSPTANIPGA